MPLGPAVPLEPGLWVRHPARPDWGTGQVQSVIGERVTVSFEHAGKILVNARHVALAVLDGPEGDGPEADGPKGDGPKADTPQIWDTDGATGGRA